MSHWSSQRDCVPAPQGRSWAEFVAKTGLGKGTVRRAFAGLPKIR